MNTKMGMTAQPYGAFGPNGNTGSVTILASEAKAAQTSARVGQAIAKARIAKGLTPKTGMTHTQSVLVGIALVGTAVAVGVAVAKKKKKKR